MPVKKISWSEHDSEKLFDPPFKINIILLNYI